MMEKEDAERIEQYWRGKQADFPVANYENANIKSWSHFRDIIEEFQSNAGNDTLLFRGQANARHDLLSTLDRHDSSDISMHEYYRQLYLIKPRIEAFTGHSWSEIKEVENPNWLSSYREVNHAFFINKLPHYEFMAYLRHCGFPSPLLDWTRSPFVASFFAFNNNKSEDRAAIFVYVGQPTGMSSGSSREAHIFRQHQYIRTHKRHFLQQSEYTICTKYRSFDGGLEHGEWYFPKYSEISISECPIQDVLVKLVFEANMRSEVLEYLNEYNINSFSLYGSEESLMDTLAFECFSKNNHRFVRTSGRNTASKPMAGSTEQT